MLYWGPGAGARVVHTGLMFPNPTYFFWGFGAYPASVSPIAYDFTKVTKCSA
jgi:hypothetical protein